MVRGPLLLPAVSKCGWWELTPDLVNKGRFPCCVYDQSLVPIRFQIFQQNQNSHFQPILKFDLRWTLTLICDIYLTPSTNAYLSHFWSMHSYDCNCVQALWKYVTVCILSYQPFHHSFCFHTYLYPYVFSFHSE